MIYLIIKNIFNHNNKTDYSCYFSKANAKCQKAFEVEFFKKIYNEERNKQINEFLRRKVKLRR